MTDRRGDDPRESADDGAGNRPDEVGQPSAPRPDETGDASAPVDADDPSPPVDDVRGGPPDRHATEADVPAPTEHPIRWYLRSEHPLVLASRDILTSVLLVAMIGLALFAVSGVWPPLVAIESGSMEPHMSQGDLVVVVEEDRFTSQLADEHGIVTREVGERIDHSQFGGPGSVIVYRPDGEERTPIIHRAAFFVEEGENWVEQADPQYLGNVERCSDVPDQCPAPYEGYVTRGDANAQYDQVGTQSDLVRPSWIEGRAIARVPYLGCIRLELSAGPGCGEDARPVG